MRTEIRRICKTAGLTAIYVTHDQKEALSIADRLAVLDQGRLLQIGTPQDVYARPVSRFVAQFIGETTFIEGRVSAVQAGLVKVTTAAQTWHAAADANIAVGATVWLSIRPETVQLYVDRTDGPNVFAADLHDTIYLGEVAQHQVALPGGVSLKALETRPKLIARDQQREAVRMYVDPQDIRVLTE
jgi:iron(III) transport system ATP-binding protein